MARPFLHTLKRLWIVICTGSSSPRVVGIVWALASTLRLGLTCPLVQSLGEGQQKRKDRPGKERFAEFTIGGLLMRESRLFGTLLPSAPEFLPIVQAMREKYQLSGISRDDKAIEEIFIDAESVRLEGFQQEIIASAHARYAKQGGDSYG